MCTQAASGGESCTRAVVGQFKDDYLQGLKPTIILRLLAA
jgi:hypothetical protein